MKILVIGLDCAAPELLFGDGLANFRRLMDRGCYGRLESIDPADHRPGLDVHGDQPGPRLARRLRVPQPRRSLLRRPRDRQLPVDRRRWRSGTRSPARGSGRSSSASRRAIPPRKVNGISRRLLPDARHGQGRLHPSRRASAARSSGSSGAIPVDVKGFRTDDKAWLRDEIYAMSRKHFEVVRHFLTERRLGLLPVRRDRPRPHPARLLEVTTTPSTSCTSPTAPTTR